MMAAMLAAGVDRTPLLALASAAIMLLMLAGVVVAAIDLRRHLRGQSPCWMAIPSLWNTGRCCQACGYDLRGQPKPPDRAQENAIIRCPECGRYS